MGEYDMQVQYNAEDKWLDLIAPERSLNGVDLKIIDSQLEFGDVCEIIFHLPEPRSGEPSLVLLCGKFVFPRWRQYKETNLLVFPVWNDETGTVNALRAYHNAVRNHKLSYLFLRNEFHTSRLCFTHN